MADIFLRRDVNGITPMDLKYMNDNFKYIWLKVFGNITTGDLLDGSISEDKIKDGAVTMDKLDAVTVFVGDGGIQLSDSATISWGQVTGTGNIADKSYVASELAKYVTSIDLSGQLSNYLNSGNFNTYITKDWIGTLGLAVGSEIMMGANATIGWANVNGKPDLALKTDIPAPPDLSPYATDADLQALNNSLSNYVLNTSLNTKLADYAKTSDLSVYAKTTDIPDTSSFITASWLSTNGYIEQQGLSETLAYYALQTDLQNYPTNDELTTALSNYITQGAFNSTLETYVTTTGLKTELGKDYVITGKILANQIASGQITGCVIQTADINNFITLDKQYMQIFYGDTPYVRLAYDSNPTLGNVLKAYLQLYDWYMTGDSNYLKMNLRGTDVLTVNGSGIQTNGINCQSISTTNNVSVGGNLTVSGTVSFSSTAYTVTAKFA